MREHKQVVGVAICAIAAAFSTAVLAGVGQTFALNFGGGGAQEVAPAPSADVVKVVARGVGLDKATALKDAYRDAVERAVGLYVDAETMAKNEDLVFHDRIVHPQQGRPDEDQVDQGRARGLSPVGEHTYGQA